MSTIRAIRTTANEALELVEIPTPTVIERFDILVRVKGIGLNPADIKVWRRYIGYFRFQLT